MKREELLTYMEDQINDPLTLCISGNMSNQDLFDAMNYALSNFQSCIRMVEGQLTPEMLLEKAKEWLKRSIAKAEYKELPDLKEKLEDLLKKTDSCIEHTGNLPNLKFEDELEQTSLF